MCGCRRRRFQSTRDHEWPRDLITFAYSMIIACFNPRATTNGRATRARASSHASSTVSIHARPRMAARPPGSKRQPNLRLFQSTRDHEWPRDRRRKLFRSTFHVVSIHARPRMAARHSGRGRRSVHHRFQSTRDHEWPRDQLDERDARRGNTFQSTRDHEWPRDVILASYGDELASFNPRATTNGRAT